MAVERINGIPADIYTLCCFMSQADDPPIPAYNRPTPDAAGIPEESLVAMPFNIENDREDADLSKAENETFWHSVMYAEIMVMTSMTLLIA